jgi:geranylgeranyl diphosphate synthase type II
MAEDLVPTLLREYSAATRNVLFQYLPQREPSRYLYDLVADYPRRGGRGFRPTLCIATARAFGRPLADALHTAASIELIHNAMLVHDDIEDESLERRGKPALQILEGIPIAINVGDALAMLSLRPLLDNWRQLGPWLTLRILQETGQMTLESAEGQAMELGWRRDNTPAVTEADYLLMVLKKTCWLATIHPTRVGALIGAGSGGDLEGLKRFGFLTGAAFQIQDDLLNLVGDKAKYGKELAGDLFEGKRTLMLIHLLEKALPHERERVLRLLGTPRAARAVREVRWVRKQMDRYDCIEYARQVAHALAGAALHEFPRLFGHLRDSRDKRFLEAFPTWVINRC